MSAQEKFTDRLRLALTHAQTECLDLGQERLEVDHLVTGLAVEADGLGGQALAIHGLNAERARTLLELRTGRGDVTPPGLRDPAALLASLGIDLGSVRGSLAESFGPEALDAARSKMWERRAERQRKLGRPRAGATPFTDDGKRVLEAMLVQAQARADAHLGTEHLLLAIIEVDSGQRSFLRDAGLDPLALAADVERLMEAAS